MLLVAAFVAYFRPQLGRVVGLLSFLLINKSAIITWLPGVSFSWIPSHPMLVFAFSLICATAILYSRELDKDRASMLLVFCAGLIGFLGATHAFEVFLFIELMLFPAFYIILKEDPSAAFKYFGFMQISSVLVLAGLVGEGLVSSMLLTIGFAIKMGLFPFHSWVPSAHAQSPFPLSALLSGALVACGAYGILMFSSTPLLVLPLGIISAVYGAFNAGAEEDIKRLLAFSTVSQMGYVGVALSAAPEVVVLFLIMHSIAKSTLFFSAGEIIKKLKLRNIHDIRVSSKSLALAVGISALCLVGFPPLLGFLVEFQVLFSSFVFSPIVGGLLAFSLIPSVLYVEKLLSIFLKEHGISLESALPLLLALLLIPGVISWTI